MRGRRRPQQQQPPLQHWARTHRSTLPAPPGLRRTFSGNRPSLSVLLPELNAYTIGQLLALYEHQVAVQVGGGRGGGDHVW